MVGTTNYSGRYSSCAQASVQTDAGKLLTTYTEVKNKLTSLRNKIDDENHGNVEDVRDYVNDAVTKANNFQNNKWDNFRNDVNSTIQLVSHPDTGLLSQLECSKQWFKFQNGSDSGGKVLTRRYVTQQCPIWL